MNNQRNIIALIKAISGQANVLTIPRIYITLTKSHRAALFLSQCVYWSGITKDPESWFYKTFPEWRDELGLPRGAVETALRTLSPWIETKVKRVGGHPKTHYKVNLDALKNSISNMLDSSTLEVSDSSTLEVSDSSTLKTLENSTLYNTEITTEITAETTSSRKRGQPDPRNASPAIVAYREVTKRYPQKVNFDRVITCLGEQPDLQKLTAAYESWCGRGYNPANLSWLDWYRDGVPANGNGKHAQERKKPDYSNVLW